MSDRANRIRLATLALAASSALLSAGWHRGVERSEPSIEAMRSLVADYAHAIETNNLELALWHVHPHSPQRAEIEAMLRDQLASYLERAQTSALEPLRLSGGSASARVDQEIVRVFGMKFSHGTRRSIYHFRALGDSWRIWGIDEVELSRSRRRSPLGPVRAGTSSAIVHQFD